MEIAKIVGNYCNSVCVYRLQNNTQLKVVPTFYARTANMGVVKFHIDR